MDESTVNSPPAGDPNLPRMAKLVYALYLVGLVFGITGIIGVVIAYVHRDEAPDWLREHFRFQIRTFWIGALYLFVGVLLLVVLIGYLVILFWCVWLIIRCVKGMKALDEQRAPDDIEAWGF